MSQSWQFKKRKKGMQKNHPIFQNEELKVYKGRNRIYIPVSIPDDWKRQLTCPEKQWIPAHSALLLYQSWANTENNGFPKPLNRAFRRANPLIFKGIYLLNAFPERPIQLPDNPATSPDDLFIVASSLYGLIVIVVEAKVKEPFSQKTIREQMKKHDQNSHMNERLDFILENLHLTKEQVEHLRMQLLYRTYSALIGAKTYHCQNALVVIQSFSKGYAHFGDYEKFLSVLGLEAKKDAIVGPYTVDGINLYFTWIWDDGNYQEPLPSIELD